MSVRIRKALSHQHVTATVTPSSTSLGSLVRAEYRPLEASQFRKHCDALILRRLQPSGTVLWLLADHQGTIRDVADNTGHGKPQETFHLIYSGGCKDCYNGQHEEPGDTFHTGNIGFNRCYVFVKEPILLQGVCW